MTEIGLITHRSTDCVYSLLPFALPKRNNQYIQYWSVTMPGAWWTAQPATLFTSITQ